MHIIILLFPLLILCFAEFYKPVVDKQTGNGLKGKIILQKARPTELSCIHLCKFKQAAISIYEKRVCTCIMEDENSDGTIETASFKSATKLWKKVETPCSTKGSQETFKGVRRECFCSGEPESTSGKIKCRDLWTLIASHVCYEGLGNKYGAFKINQSGVLKSMMLDHISGLITCDKNNPKFGSSIWTCNSDKTQLSTYVTNTNNTIIFPSGVTIHPYVSKVKFANKNVFQMTQKNLIYYGPVVDVTVGMEFRIWNANDLGGDISDRDNKGRHCVDVYGQFDEAS